MKSLVYLVVCCLSLTFAHPQKPSPLKFAACKKRLLSVDTGITLRNKDWKGKQFVNIVTKSEPKSHCLWSSRWTELDTSMHPPFVIFHQRFQWTFASGKGHAQLSEMYEIKPDHYVFRYSNGQDSVASTVGHIRFYSRSRIEYQIMSREIGRPTLWVMAACLPARQPYYNPDRTRLEREKAKVHIKWLKLIPGVLEIQYMCSDDFMFAENVNDFVVVTTPSAVFSKTVSDLTKNILQRERFKLKNLFIVPNCQCALKKPKRVKSCVNKPLLHFFK